MTYVAFAVETHRHGGPFDRGGADAYYGREFDPHYYEGATYKSRRVPMAEMSAGEIEQYARGYNGTTDRKDYGDINDCCVEHSTVETEDSDERI